MNLPTQRTFFCVKSFSCWKRNMLIFLFFFLRHRTSRRSNVFGFDLDFVNFVLPSSIYSLFLSFFFAWHKEADSYDGIWWRIKNSFDFFFRSCFSNMFCASSEKLVHKHLAVLQFPWLLLECKATMLNVYCSKVKEGEAKRNYWIFIWINSRNSRNSTEWCKSHLL